MSDYIIQDLLFPILKSLPIEDLLRCRSVCKSWKELVDSKPFIDDHLAVQKPHFIAQIENSKYVLLDPHTILPLFDELRRSDRAPIGITFTRFTTYFTLQIQEFEDNEFVRSNHLAFVGAVHGVICLYNDNENLVIIWNPSIRRHLNLPPPQFSLCPNPNHFDSKCCGFWIDPSNKNDFKVVIFWFAKDEAALYSSRKQTWMEVDMEPRDESWTCAGKLQVLIEGVGHWKVYDRHSREKRAIVWFDFVREGFGRIDFPELGEVRGVCYDTCVIKWKGSVSIVHWQVDWPCGYDLWAMRNGLWSKMFSFIVHPSISDVFYVVEDHGRFLGCCYSGPLAFYDSKDGFIYLRSNEVVVDECAFLADDFVESLVFPGGKCVSDDSLFGVFLTWFSRD